MPRPPSLSADDRRRLCARTVWRGDSSQDEDVAEVAAYAERSRGRLAISVELVERLLAEHPGLPVLELGADPWHFTQLLLERGVVPVTGGLDSGADAGRQRVTIAWADRRESFEQHLFDVERDRWPFADGTFGIVVCMEILEHLTVSPAHLLYETNRVLVPGGALLLTTPNALAAHKLAALLRGRTVHWAYSGHGVSGRHNREFTPDEVRLVLEEANFNVRLTMANLAGYEAREPLARGLQRLAGLLPFARARRRRDHIFAIARKSGPPRLSFPPSLYRSFSRERLRGQGVMLPDEPSVEASAEAAGDDRGRAAGRGGPSG